MKPKKILFVCHKMNLGGTEKALLSLLKVLPYRELEIEVLLLDQGGILEASIPNYVKVSYLDEFKSIKPYIYDPPLQVVKKLFRQGKILKGLQHLAIYVKVKVSGNWHHFYRPAIKQISHVGDYDIAVAFAGPSDFISYLVLNKTHATKKVQWNHFDVEKIINNPNFGRKFYPQFNQFFSVSENAKVSIDKMFPFIEKRSFVFENIVSAKELQELAEKGKSFSDDYKGLRIVTLGRLSKEKGQQLIPSVVKRLKEMGFDFRWYLIGDGKLRNMLELKINKLTIQKELRLLGAQTNPYAYLKEADIYVQPSLTEGYGISLKEAQVFNLPIVTTDFLSASNLIKNGETGLIVPISEDGIYQGVKRLLFDPQLRKKLTDKSFKEQNYQKNVDRLLKID